MKKLFCIVLVVSLIMSLAIPSFAAESKDVKYGSIKVEYSNAVGQIEYLNVMVQDSCVYADAYSLSERLGYKCKQEGNIVSIYGENTFFDRKVPLLAVHFKINSTDVSYNPLFGAEYKYDAPAPCIENDKGIWIPLCYALVLLGGNSTMLQDTLLIQIPRENVLSIAAMIANNDTLLSFDWNDDFGYSETATNISSGAGRIVTLFSGLLEFDGNAWLSLVDWSAFDKKFGRSLASMLTTDSSDELLHSIEEVEILLNVFSPDGILGSMLRNKEIRIDSDVTVWKAACEEYLELLEEGSGSPAKYNLLYQQYERVMHDQDMFVKFGGEDIIYIQDELSSATNILEYASLIGTGVSYLKEFQQRDDYKILVLKNYLASRTPTAMLPDATAESMRKYTDSGALEYTSVRIFEENALEFIVDHSGLDAYLGVPANLLLFSWDIMSQTIPFYSKGLSAVEQREISNYAQKLQNDALLNLKQLMLKLRSNATISEQDCVQLSEYCYVFLKASYITRSAAVASLESTSREFREEIKGKLENEANLNQIIARKLALLSTANEENTCYILGFLTDNSKNDFEAGSDGPLLTAVIPESEFAGSDNAAQSKKLVSINTYNNGEFGDTYKLSYDSDGRLSSLYYKRKNGTTQVSEYTYDQNGNLLTVLTQLPSGDSQGSVYTYTYKDGKVTEYQVTEVWNGQTGPSWNYSYNYDEQGRIARRTMDVTYVEGCTYDYTDYAYENNRIIEHNYNDCSSGFGVKSEIITTKSIIQKGQSWNPIEVVAWNNDKYSGIDISLKLSDFGNEALGTNGYITANGKLEYDEDGTLQTIQDGDTCLEFLYEDTEAKANGGDRRGYIPVIQDALDVINKAEATAYPTFGHGMLYDIDANGVEELIMIHGDEHLGLDCSIYTLKEGYPVALVEKEPIGAQVAGCEGHVSLVQEADGVKLALTIEVGETDSSDGVERRGNWKVYTIDGIHARIDMEISYEYTYYQQAYGIREIWYNDSEAVINGTTCGYDVYEQWRDSLNEALIIEALGDTKTMALEDLIVWLQDNSDIS